MIREYFTGYHEDRNHQGIDNRLIEPRGMIVALDGRVARRERLGGLLNYYYAEAA